MALEGVRIRIRFHHDQVGTLVQASIDGGDWKPVQLLKHGEHEAAGYGWGGRSKVMSTARDEAVYLKTLDDKGIAYEVVRGGS